MTTPKQDPNRSDRTPRRRARTRPVLVALLACAALGLGCRERNGNDTAPGTVAASFSVSQTSGAVGLVVQFTDASRGDVDAYRWDFGNGETSDQPNPVVTYSAAGSYDVSLTVYGSRGSSTKAAPDLILVEDAPTAGFDCLAKDGLAPLTTTCVSSARGATSFSWTFSNGVDTILSSETSPTVTLSSGGTWTVTQRVENVAGSDTASDSITVQQIVITVTPLVGPGPGEATLSADTGSYSGLTSWFVDGTFVSNLPTTTYDFRLPGTYEVKLEFGSLFPPVLVEETFEYVVADVAVSADFAPSVDEGPGPLEVTFADRSLGVVDEWAWDFGDGTSCVFPDPGGAAEVCDAASPTHTYAGVGRYDVTLTVNPNASDPVLRDTLSRPDAVTVTILDPSFEAQTVAAEIAAGWSVLRPAGATAVAQHVTHGRREPAGADAGMPTQGDQWASLDGLGTDGSDPASSVENGIETTFVLPFGRPVIEFDYVLLQAEPPAGLVRDAMTATVSDGVDTVEITSAAADSWSAYAAGGSGRFPTLDGGTTRVTPLRTASLDVESAFPSAGPDTEYTLTIRLTNDANGFRPPRAYVDHVRFVERAAPIVADFLAPTTIVAGEPADFVDATCPDPAGSGCEVPTSWRWDFDTREAIVPPEATGSALQDPSYVFDEPGDYDVRLWARNADQESEAVMTVNVLEAPVAIPVVVSVVRSGPYWEVDVRSDSTSDPTDDITQWSWDFAGWATSSLADPAPVEIRQAGTWTIRLTVKTSREIVAAGSVDVELN